MDVKDVHLKTGKTGKGLVGDARGIVTIIGNGEMSRMTREKEAIERINDHITVHKYHERNAVKIIEAIKALEAQIPKPPTVRDRRNPNLCHLYCPTCGSWVGMYNKRTNMYNMHNKVNCGMCAKCGQTLDLSGEQE